MNIKDSTQHLLNLGLTNSQAKVYLALLSLGADFKGTTIAKFADVPRQDVYRLLSELQQIGIVQKSFERPATFKGVLPKTAMSILLERKMTDFSQLKNEADAFVKDTKDAFGKQFTQTEVDQFILLSDREALICEARNSIENTKTSFNSITQFNELVSWISVLSKSIDDALIRGVKIRWIIDKPVNEKVVSNQLINYIISQNFRVRYLSEPIRAKMGIFDSRKLILAIFKDAGFARSPALWSNNASLIALAESHFEICWKRAVDLKLENISKANLLV